MRFLFVAGSLLLAAPSRAAAPAGMRAPDREKLEAADGHVARMKAILRAVVDRAEQARSEKDVAKLNCVSGKLTQIQGLLRVAERSSVALHESLASGAGGGEAEFSKLAMTRTKVDRLRREAEECIGQLAYMVEEKTLVEVEQPAGLAGQDEAGLGVTARTENPADLASRMGARERRRGGTFDPPASVIVRPPAALP